MSKEKVLYTKALVEKASEGEFVAVASTATVDRHDEIVEVEGWDLKNFKSNPVILYGHKHDEPPIGKATRVWVDKTGKSPVLKFKAVLTDATQRAKEIKQLMAEGIMKTFSVSFKAIDAEDNRFTKQELLEISAVNVPANPDAQLLAFKSLSQAGFDEKAMNDVGVDVDMVKQMPSASKMRSAMKAMQTAMGHMEDMMGMMDEGKSSELDQVKQELQIMKGKLDIAVKGLELSPHLASHKGRSQRLLTERLQYSKAIVRAADKILEKPQMPKDKKERLVKAIKLAGQQVIVSQKQELNGTHKRPAR